MLLHLDYLNSKAKTLHLIQESSKLLSLAQASNETIKKIHESFHQIHRIQLYFFHCLPHNEQIILDFAFTRSVLYPSLTTLTKLNKTLATCYKNSALLRTHNDWIRNVSMANPLRKKPWLRLAKTKRYKFQRSAYELDIHHHLAFYCKTHGRTATKKLTSMIDKNGIKYTISKYDLKFINNPPINGIFYGYTYLPSRKYHAYCDTEWININKIMKIYNDQPKEPDSIYRESKRIYNILDRSIKRQYIECAIREILSFWNIPMNISYENLGLKHINP